MKLQVEAKLDKGFAPLAIAFRDYSQAVSKSNDKQKFVCAIERENGFSTPFVCDIFKDGVNDDQTVALFDRIIKGLLWMYGGYKIKVYGSKNIYEHLKKAYTMQGERAFDVNHMETVYEKPFEVLYFEDPSKIENPNESASSIGKHLDGCRIGFDAGGSDRKVSAVIDGEAVFSEEVVWHPKTQSNPDYHYEGILAAMKSAAEHMPRVDAIGVSSAGDFVDNEVKVASLFLKVSKEDFDKKVKTIYIDIAKEFGDVPLVVANDGDVTALAGAMNLEDGNVLGIAMGTSEAGGYVDKNMNIMGWLNELAFAPVDMNPNAMVDEWSGDYGCGVKYFSQDGVIKLAPAAGIELDAELSPAEKLKVVQKKLEENHQGAKEIFETIGVYFGYTVAYYALFYKIKHVLILGRVTSGDGGTLILNKAQEVLSKEFPELAEQIKLHIPDENSRRVGQSVAAASLPEIK
ncbi:MAG: ROK family protein [Eubacteriales bacterium]|nr:ROK family protein [Eubacteriales bacterium]